MRDEESWNIAIEDDNLGFIVLLQSGHEIGEVVLGVLIP